MPQAPAYATLCVIALSGLILLLATFAMPRIGPRLGGWSAVLVGAGLVLTLLPTSAVGRRQASAEIQMLAVGVSSYAGLGLALGLQGLLRLGEDNDEERSENDRPASGRGWTGFRWGLPAAAVLTAIIVGWQRGQLPAGRTLAPVELTFGLRFLLLDLFHVVGLLSLALGAGMVPGLASKKSVVHEAMLAAGVLGVPCAAYAGLRGAVERPQHPLLHPLAGPAGVAAVCFVLLAALYVRRWQLVLEEDRAGTAAGDGR